MFKNYLLVAWRHLLKNRMYSSIKVGGFALGICAFILIMLFVKDEMDYDSYYQEQDRIFRVINYFNDADQGRWVAFPAEMAAAIKSSFPEVELAGRLIPYAGWFDSGDNQFRRADRKENAYEERFAYADPALLQILEVPMVYGTREDALTQGNTIVISRRKAEKYFPDQNPVGQFVVLNDQVDDPFMIGGVMENPGNTHVQFDFLITLSQREFWPGEQTNWCCWNYDTYLRLREGADAIQLAEKMRLIKDQYIVGYAEEQGEADVEEIREYHEFELQPIQDIHLRSGDIHNITGTGSIAIVRMFVIIAFFVLLLACVNFVNLATAKSANRAKEVGVRKAVGSFRHQLVQQFLTESMLTSLISLALAWGLVLIASPAFNQLSGKSLYIPWDAWWFVPANILFVLVMAALAGIYPSLYLSAFRSVEVLKGLKSRGSHHASLRNVMVIFQFVTSIVLVIGALMVSAQLDFVLKKELGFEKEQVFLIQAANTLGDNSAAFKEELKHLAAVKSVSLSNYLPVTGTRRDQNGFWKEGRRELDKLVGAQRWRVDLDYLETMGMKLVAGRNFTDAATDTSAIIVNEKMALELGLDNPIGARIENSWTSWTVVGVVENFHFDDMKQEIAPLGLCRSEAGDVVAVKLHSTDVSDAVEEITGVWDRFMPNQPIRYTFLDQSFARMYEGIARMARLVSVFAALAIIVACLGLFGLSAYMVEQRSKEISIRKVLGASLARIFSLLTIDYVKMIVVALVIAVPLAIYLVSRWLADYKYAVDMSWEVFVLAGFLTLVVSLITVSFESLKASILNPVKGLRSE